MINNIDPTLSGHGIAAVESAKSNNLLLHCGAETVEREQLSRVTTPKPTRTWYPLPHNDGLDLVEHRLWLAGFHVDGETHALSHEGQRYFGVLQVRRPGVPERSDYTWLIGVRNSHDKSLPAGLVAGTRVFVCDNLAFSGEVKIQRKHTANVLRDLRHLIRDAVNQLSDSLVQIDRKFEHLQSTIVRNPAAHDLMIKAVDQGAITVTQIPEVLEQWREPDHDEFRPRTAWSLFNAFTEVTKKLPPNLQVERGERLQNLFDQRYGLTA